MVKLVDTIEKDRDYVNFARALVTLCNFDVEYFYKSYYSGIKIDPGDEDDAWEFEYDSICEELKSVVTTIEKYLPKYVSFLEMISKIQLEVRDHILAATVADD